MWRITNLYFKVDGGHTKGRDNHHLVKCAMFYGSFEERDKHQRKREASIGCLLYVPRQGIVSTRPREWTCNLGMCPGWESNLQPFSVENDALTEPPGQGYFFILKIGVSCPGWRGSVVEHGPANQMVASSVPSQGTCLGWRPGPQWGVCERQPHIDVSLHLFLPPFTSLKINE